MNANIIGTPLPRIDGPRKVSGHAHYTADRHLPGMLVGVPVCATVGRGHVKAIDSAAAAAMPGVHDIYTHENFGTLHRLPADSELRIDERRPPLQDNEVRYYGQYVALVLADTFERASAAAAAVRVADVTPQFRLLLLARLAIGVVVFEMTVVVALAEQPLVFVTITV